MHTRCGLLYRDAELLVHIALMNYNKKPKVLPKDICSSELCHINSPDSKCFTDLFTYAAKLCLNLCASELALAAGCPCPASVTLYNKRKRNYCLTIPSGFLSQMVQLPCLDFTDVALSRLMSFVTAIAQSNNVTNARSSMADLVAEVVDLIFAFGSLGLPTGLYARQIHYLCNCFKSLVISMSSFLANLNRFVLWVYPDAYASDKFYFPQAYNLNSAVSSMFSPHGMCLPDSHLNFFSFITTPTRDRPLFSAPLVLYYFSFCHLIMLLTEVLPVFPYLVEQVLDMPVLEERPENLTDVAQINTELDQTIAASLDPQTLFDQALQTVVMGGV